jgi:hypothetical protein
MSGEYTGPRHISDAIITENAAGLADQSTSEKWKRTATLPEDWNYRLAPGVATKQVSFYVDGGTRLQGKVFYPKDFDPKASYPGIVVGHGINALAIGIEKYAAKFASAGLSPWRSTIRAMASRTRALTNCSCSYQTPRPTLAP